MPTHYHDGGIAPRTNTYPYGVGGRKRMPQKSRPKPSGREARQRRNGLMVRRIAPAKPRRDSVAD